jgi:DNA repair photolyase
VSSEQVRDKEKGNMYGESVLQWNLFVGCEYTCRYCEKSFKAQMKRQEHNCKLCYNYNPHFHPERLKKNLPATKEDQFIWPCSSGDINFMKDDWLRQLSNKIHENPDKTFLLQSKRPATFKRLKWPKNVILGTTVETNRIKHYNLISNAPNPRARIFQLDELDHKYKSITIEPILCFDTEEFLDLLKEVTPKPRWIFIGYDSKKCGLPEPSLNKTRTFIKLLKKHFGPDTVKLKLIRPKQPVCKELAIMANGQQNLAQYIGGAR